MTKPTPMTPTEVHAIAFDTRYEGITDTCRAIEAAVNARWEAMLKQEPVKFLANGTRFKLSYMDDYEDGEPTGATYVSCFEGWEKELDGRWVALVAAEDDCHLKMAAPVAQPAQQDISEILNRLEPFVGGLGKAILREAKSAAQPAQKEPEGWNPNTAKPMTPKRAHYFMERFKKEEKLLGPNEQAAVDYVLALLKAQPAQQERTCENCKHLERQVCIGCRDGVHDKWEPK